MRLLMVLPMVVVVLPMVVVVLPMVVVITVPRFERRPRARVPQDTDTVNAVGYHQISLMIENDIVCGLASLTVIDGIGVGSVQIGVFRVREDDHAQVPVREGEVLIGLPVNFPFGAGHELAGV